MYKQVRDGKVVGLYKWPNELTKDNLGKDLVATEEEVQAFESKRREKPKAPIDKLKEILVNKSILTQKEADSL
jgi:hypothetical protein